MMVRLKELIPPGGRALDAGCGTGARDDYNIVGLDVTEENIRVAREPIRRSPIECGWQT